MAGYPDVLLEHYDNKVEALISKILADRDNLPPAIVELAETASKLEAEYCEQQKKRWSEGVMG
jgi:hypothetical protein